MGNKRLKIDPETRRQIENHMLKLGGAKTDPRSFAENVRAAARRADPSNPASNTFVLGILAIEDLEAFCEKHMPTGADVSCVAMTMLSVMAGVEAYKLNKDEVGILNSVDILKTVALEVGMGLMDAEEEQLAAGLAGVLGKMFRRGG